MQTPVAADAAAPASKRPAPVVLPEFVQHRIQMWDALKAKQQAEKEKNEPKPIKITLQPEGQVHEGVAGVTTPLDIAEKVHGKDLRMNVVVARANGQLVDCWYPLHEDTTLELLQWESEEARKVFWHSSAHILGQVLEKKYGCNLCTGPPLDEGGFFYEARMPDETQSVSTEDFKVLNKDILRVIKDRQQFERLLVPKEYALEMFKYNPYKSEILRDKVPEGGSCTVYRCGTLIDPCRGPHVVNTGFVKAFDVSMVSSSYWKGKAENDRLQRVYGISFRTVQELKEHKTRIEEAAKRDHRKVGKEQELFFFHPLSPGSCFFLPHGTRIYNRLLEFLRNEYRNRGFQEVITPNAYSCKLWETSGHWAKYKENMFTFQCDNQDFALKPMNCPGHCLLFGHRSRSYRELPLRVADFGVLHRNELSGALTGLTRVRRFQQDDAHIFCMPSQIEAEITSCLGFMQHVYGIFGYEFDLELSTRPENFLGEVELWNKAEAQLKAVLEAFGKPWILNPGDGAFYGPKIDIHIRDALRRSHQCATIQLDFQLPIRFELEYMTGEVGAEVERPVMIHRAILGSVERMFAILVEHTGGKWPFWLSPRQVIIIPIEDVG
eukprot:TRINITY_DN10501_c0_g1_i1.p1 TRINITY_DN10501_c0_g1~~TRINITY_DN10501_c0_g1_i1.p1  ORF type:complete len:607 (-),score=68.43 TRINITY_DN10501_c0_g1_i1:131-1951(-)